MIRGLCFTFGVCYFTIWTTHTAKFRKCNSRAVYVERNVSRKSLEIRRVLIYQMYFRKIVNREKSDANIACSIFSQRYFLKIDRNKKGFLKDMGGRSRSSV